MEDRISLIVPVYNTEQYLKKCVDSIKAQSFKNLEILLIDDGSEKDCADLCDFLAGTDPRIRVIHQKNRGLSGARNRGLDECTGEWVLFVDSDDTISANCCRHTLVNGLENAADAVVFGYRRIFDSEEIKADLHGRTALPDESRVWTRDEVMLSLLDNRFGNFAWNRLCRRELYQNVRFPEGRLYEDIGTTWRLMENAQKVSYLKEDLYEYRQHSGTISRVNNSRAVSDDYQMREELWVHLERHYPKVTEGNSYFIISPALKYCTYVERKTDPVIYDRAAAYVRNAKTVPEALSPRQKALMKLFRTSEGLFCLMSKMIQKGKK